MKAEEFTEPIDSSCKSIGHCMDETIMPLIEDHYLRPGSNPRADRYARACNQYADKVLSLLEPSRDLAESNILVLDNGSGIVPFRLAQSGADVVAAEPTSKMVDTARRFNSYPSIIYKKWSPACLEEQYDLVIDTGTLSYYSREGLKELLCWLSAHCRRKMILEFYPTRPWYFRLLARGGGIEFGGVCPTLTPIRLEEKDIVELIEQDCGMLLTDRLAGRQRVVIKALRRPQKSFGS